MVRLRAGYCASRSLYWKWQLFRPMRIREPEPPKSTTHSRERGRHWNQRNSVALGFHSSSLSRTRNARYRKCVSVPLLPSSNSVSPITDHHAAVNSHADKADQFCIPCYRRFGGPFQHSKPYRVYSALSCVATLHLGDRPAPIWLYSTILHPTPRCYSACVFGLRNCLQSRHSSSRLPIILLLG